MKAKMAGAKARAGFMEAPVKAPPIKAQMVTVSPLAKPEAAEGKRLTVAAAMMTNISRKGRTTSTKNPPAKLKVGGRFFVVADSHCSK